jgi:hypothetical protein
MGKWRYGLVLHLNEQYGNWYGVHSVYPNDNGKNPSWSKEPAKPMSDDPLDIEEELNMMLRDIKMHPVIVTNLENIYVETLPLAETIEKYGSVGLNTRNDDI